MMRTLTIVTALSLPLACTGTEVGNPVNVDLDLYNAQFEPAPPAATEWRAMGVVEIDEAWVAIDRIRLRSAAACDGEAEREYEGPFYVDLLAPGPSEALAGLDIPDTDYCRFELKWNAFDEPLPADVPPELRAASVFLAGTRADGVRFELRSARDDEFRLDAVGDAFAVSAATSALIVAFDGERLFAGVDLDAAEVGGDGVIHIDGENNELLLETFDANLRAAAELFDDDDGDGVLDPDERDEADALAR